MTRMYSIRLLKRDGLGNPTGKYLEYETDDAGKLAAWYERHAWRKPFKRKKWKKKKRKKQSPMASRKKKKNKA